MNVYFSNGEGITEQCNEACAVSCGYKSVKEAIGKSIFDSPYVNNESNQICFNTNQDIIKSNRLKMIEERIYDQDGTGWQTLSIKLPWYDDNNKTIGIFGWSIVIGQQPLAESLTLLMKNGFVKPAVDLVDNYASVTGRQIGNIYFSKREFECLTLLTKGKSAPEMGKILGLSHRTIEQYLASCKLKLKVRTKSQLIDKVRAYFL
ncbi:helix-turn-helix domain-containing protein [Legionella birminghamensis]|nr:helix-turn-helix transcriptional regulator [Legionella birminghamensis]